MSTARFRPRPGHAPGGAGALTRAGLLAVLSVALLPPGVCSASPATGLYQYLSPLPGARMVSPWNDIVVRRGEAVDPGTIGAAALSVVGTVSGQHPGQLVLSDDSRTLVFQPDRPFALGEEVTVTLAGDVRGLDGSRWPPLSFRFQVSRIDPRRQPRLTEQEQMDGAPAPLMPTASSPEAGPADAARPLPSRQPPANPDDASCDTLPPTYPAITVTSLDDPDPDPLFFAPYGYSGAGGHLIIMDRRGEVLFYRRLSLLATDFKVQPYGLITYYSGTAYLGLDSTYTIVDSWQPKNGYGIDTHELLLLPNGHALLLAEDPEPVPMDTVVAGGDPAATVVGLIIQELDTAKNVVFQWRSWDHFQITDAVDVDLTAAYIDYVHGNSLDVDADGNLLLSSRHLNELTKIDRQTGDVLWRMGLNAVNNQFDFVNDTRGFEYQHHARWLPNGNLTVFDNGNFQNPEYSSGLEYEVDQEHHTATLVWDYRHSPDLFGPSLGSTQRLPNGGALICWGGTTVNPRLTELHADGSVALELGLPSNRWTYRAFHSPWQTTRFATDASSLDFGAVAVGEAATLPLRVINTSSTPVSITCFKSTSPLFSVTGPYPATLAPGDTLAVEVTFSPAASGQQQGAIYARSIEGTDVIARAVEVSGLGSDLIGVAAEPALGYRLYQIGPNPFAGSARIRFDLPRTSHVSLEVFDVAGRKVRTLVDGTLGRGHYERQWRPRAMLKNGLYFCRFAAGGFVATGKVALLR